MFTFFVTHPYQRIIFISFFLLFCQVALAQQKPYAPEYIEGVEIVSSEQVIDLILGNPDLLVIDSRKKTEYLKGHIEGSINILNTEFTREQIEDLSPDKSKAILFYCNGTRCLRSSDSIYKAKRWGYRQLFWFRGGWKEWSDKRLPVVID